MGLSSFGCGVTSDWVASWSLTWLEDGHGGWDCLISDAVLLRLGGQLEFDVVGGRTRGLELSYFGCGVTSNCVASWSLTRWEDGHGGLGLSYFGCGVTSDWVASWSLTRLEDGHGGWDCHISDAVLLQIGWPVGVVDAVGGRTRGLGLSYFGCGVTSDWVASWSLTRWEDGHGGGDGLGLSSFRMRCYFRLGGQLEFDVVGGRTRGLGLSHFGCGVTSDWVASWSLTRLEDGHGGWDCLISDAVLLQMGGQLEFDAVGGRTRGEGRGWDCLISDAVLLQTGWPVGV